MPDSFCDENQGLVDLALTWVLLSIGILVVSLRIYVRSGANRRIGWDDYTAVASLAIAILASGFFTKLIASGMGRHVSCVPPESVIAMLEFSAISEPLNVLGIGMVKISVCLALLRVVERARRGITMFLRSLLAFVDVTHLALAMILFLHCVPLAALWNPEVHGSCLSTHSTVLAGYIGFAIDVVTDLVCAGIPVLVIHRLQMSFRNKITLCVLMGLGVFTAGCAVAKAVTLRGVFADDYTFGFTKPATWAAVEQLVGIIIISIPPLRPLLSSFRGREFVSRDSGKKGRQQQQQEQQRLQVPRSDSGLEESMKTGKTLMPWCRDSRGSSSSSNDLDIANAVREQRLDGARRGVNPERELLGDDLRHVGVSNHLKAWPLPDIADRDSEMISIPLFQV